MTFYGIFRDDGFAKSHQERLCEQSEAICVYNFLILRDCFVAVLLAMKDRSTFCEFIKDGLCIIFMKQYKPASILIFPLYEVGIFSPLWAFLPDIAGRKGDAPIFQPVFLKKLYGIGLLSLSSSIVLLVIQVLLHMVRSL